MSERLYLIDINLNGNQLKSAVVEKLPNAPANPVAGQIYFNVGDSKFYYYNGTKWISGAEYKGANTVAEDAEGVRYGLYDGMTDSTLKFRVLETIDTRVKLSKDSEQGIIKIGLDMKYKSAMPDDLEVPTKVGGINAGATAGELKAKTVDQVLDDLLFPELQPTVTAPSVSISFANGFSANGIYEVGATAPVAANFSHNFSQGSSVVGGQATLHRSGAEDTPNSAILYNGATSLAAKVVLGDMAYTYKAAYLSGPQLVTSKGKKASIQPNPLPAGTVTSGAIHIYGTYPYFCNGTSASSSATDTNFPSAFTADTKMTLQKWTDTLVGAKFASEAAKDTRIEFKFPSTKRVTKVEFMNTVSGKWEAFQSGSQTSAGNITVQGVNVAYTKWTTQGALNGAIQLRFTLANA